MPEVISILGETVTGPMAKAFLFGGLIVGAVMTAVFVSLLDLVREEMNDDSSELGFSDLRRGHGPYGDVTKAGDEV